MDILMLKKKGLCQRHFSQNSVKDGLSFCMYLMADKNLFRAEGVNFTFIMSVGTPVLTPCVLLAISMQAELLNLITSYPFHICTEAPDSAAV